MQRGFNECYDIAPIYLLNNKLFKKKMIKNCGNDTKTSQILKCQGFFKGFQGSSSGVPGMLQLVTEVLGSFRRCHGCSRGFKGVKEELPPRSSSVLGV